MDHVQLFYRDDTDVAWAHFSDLRKTSVKTNGNLIFLTILTMEI